MSSKILDCPVLTPTYEEFKNFRNFTKEIEK